MIHRLGVAAVLTATLLVTTAAAGGVVTQQIITDGTGEWHMSLGNFTWGGEEYYNPGTAATQGPLDILFKGLSNNPNNTWAAAEAQCTLPNGELRVYRYKSGMLGNPTAGGGSVMDRLGRFGASLGTIVLESDIPVGEGCQTDAPWITVYVAGKRCGLFESCQHNVRTSLTRAARLETETSCTVTATNINLGNLAAGDIEGAVGVSDVMVTCGPSPSTVRVTAKGQQGGEDVTFGAGAMLGALKVNGAPGLTGAVVEGVGGGTAVQVSVQLSDISAGKVPAGQYNGMAVITVTPE
ncbi:exported hypothetical protein [Pseudomonas serboccidentalis]